MGHRCLNSKTDDRASAAGTSSHDVGDRAGIQPMGTRTTFSCHAHASIELSSGSPSMALLLASTSSGHAHHELAPNGWVPSSCQQLGSRPACECHAHASKRQLQCAPRLGACPEGSGRNWVINAGDRLGP